MSITARGTHPSQTYRQLRTIGSSASVAHSKHDLAHAILTPFVIDDAARTEFGQAKEAWPGEEGILADAFLARRDKRHEWQAWKVVPGQEALAREIAVGVEVGIHRGRRLQK